MDLVNFTDAWDMMGKGKRMKPLSEKQLPYHYERKNGLFYLCFISSDGDVHRFELKDISVKVLQENWVECKDEDF